MDENENTSSESEAMELNPTNAFGELLLDLIEAQYEGDIDAGIAALVQATGLDEEEVTSIISGESIVDDPDVLAAIISAFPDANDEDIETIIEVASGVEEEDRNAIEAQYAGEEGTTRMNPEEQAANYAAAYNPTIQANFNSKIQRQIERLNAEKEEMRAEFAKQQFTTQLSSYLSDFDARLEQDVVGGVLPPSVKQALIGSFKNPAQRLAQFSAITESNGARDLQEQLYASEFAYSLLKNVANVVQFTDYSVSAEEAATANFSASLQESAKADLEAIGLDLAALGL